MSQKILSPTTAVVNDHCSYFMYSRELSPLEDQQAHFIGWGILAKLALTHESLHPVKICSSQMVVDFNFALLLQTNMAASLKLSSGRILLVHLIVF